MFSGILSPKDPFLLSFVFLLYESLEVTLQFFGYDDFLVIITFCVFGDFFYSYIHDSIYLASDSDLTNYVCL